MTRVEYTPEGFVIQQRAGRRMTDRLHETIPCPCCGRPCGLDEDLSWPDRDTAIRALVQIAVGTTRDDG